MSAIFGPSEIATLLTTFPPPLPTREKPSLLRSKTDQAALLSSEYILQQFRELLRTSTSRIIIKDLPSKLGIDQTDWLFECYDGELFYSSDRQALIPLIDQEKLRRLLESRSNDELLELATFAATNDCSLPSARLLIDDGLSTFLDEKGRLQVYSSAFEQRYKEQIQQQISDATSDVVVLDLDLPISLAEKIALGALDVSKGAIEVKSGRIKFIPTGYDDVVQRKRDWIIEALLTDISTQGWCSIPDDVDYGIGTRSDLRQSLATETRGKAGSDAVLLGKLDESGDGSLEIWATEALTQRISALTKTADDAITTFWATRDMTQSDSDLKSSFLAQLLEASPGTSPLILSSPLASPLHNNLTTLFTEMEADDTQLYKQTLQISLAAHLELYTTSLTLIQDQTLHTNLDAFYATHFHREILPEIFSPTSPLSLSPSHSRLLYKSSRSRDVEKFLSTLSTTHSFREMRDVISRFLKKQRVEPPSKETVAETKRRSVQRLVKGIKGMSRGSDVLQNLIWVLLAERCEGLFVSAGKDTGRMIKLFRAVGGDEEVAGCLDGWREMLKTGKEDKAELEKMKRMAADHV